MDSEPDPKHHALQESSQSLRESFDFINDSLLARKSPSEIAADLGVPLGTVVDHLWRMLGRYGLSARVIYFNIEPEIREAVHELISKYPVVALHPLNAEAVLRGLEITIDKAELIILAMRCEEQLAESAYGEIALIEYGIASIVKTEFSQLYGEQWWREGVPEDIRASCAAAQERDPEPSDNKLCYATFIELSEILNT